MGGARASGSRTAANGRHKRVRLEPHRAFLEGLWAEKSDITLQALCDRLVRARRQGRHLADEPLLAPSRRHAQKKTLVAREQDRPDVKRHRLRWRSHQRRVDPSRLVSRRDLDQDHMTRLYGWAQRGRRLVAKVPHGHWKTATSSPLCATTASKRRACSTDPSTASAFWPTSNSSSFRPSSATTSSCSTTSDRTKERRCAKRSRPQGPVCCSCPNTPPISSDRAGVRQAESPGAKGCATLPRRGLPRIATALMAIPPQECANYLRNSGYA